MSILAVAIPKTGNAWFFSAASAQSGITPTPITAGGVQNMPLLSAGVAMMSDLRAVDEESDIHIEDSEAIVADIGSSGTLADVIDIPTTDTISTYIVQPGDSVAMVAKRFGVSENTVRWANGLGKKDVLHVGQQLVILPITGVKHKVQKGDTLASIAKKYKADAADIADYNNLEVTDGLMIGDTIIVPEGEVTITQTVTDKSGKSRTVTVTGTGLKGGTPAKSGYYIQPVVPNGGRIRKTQGFHTRYNAIDVGAPVGTPIRAMASGTVIVTKSPNGYNGGYGGLTIISHSNGSQTLYAHQSKILVSSGESVSQGQIIGYTGNTGKSTGPHLHFEIRGVYPTPKLY